MSQFLQLSETSWLNLEKLVYINAYADGQGLAILIQGSDEAILLPLDESAVLAAYLRAQSIKVHL